MLHLVTGTPGAGKTLFTLSQVFGEDGSRELDRPVYIDGIDTDLPHEVIDGKRWHLDAPDGAIIIIDEAQRVFRPRPRGAAVPEYFSEIETHRHKGIDIWLISQDSFLIDAHVRRLVGEYFRIDRPGSMRYLRIRRYEKVPAYDDKSGPVETLRKKHPKDLYDRYKSTTMDTHRAKIPFKLYVYGVFLLAAILGVGYVVWLLFSGGIFGGSDDEVTGQEEKGIFQLANDEISGGVARSAGLGGGGSDGHKILDLRTLFAPVIRGKPWTAPVYHEVLTDEPVPPLPAACVIFEQSRSVGRVQVSDMGGCRCYTDRAVRLDVKHEFCVSFVRDGWHDPTGGRFRVRDSGGSADREDILGLDVGGVPDLVSGSDQ